MVEKKIGDYPNKNKEKNDVPVYYKIFFREICKRNIANIIALNYYRDGGVHVLLGENRR